MSEALRAAAAVPTAIGAAVLVVGIGRALLGPGRTAGMLAEAFALALELFLAAGLLRLAALQDPQSLALAAAVVLLRRVIALGVRYGARAADG